MTMAFVDAGNSYDTHFSQTHAKMNERQPLLARRSLPPK